MLNISHETAETLDSNFSFTIKNILNFQKAELNETLYKKIYGEESDITTEEQFKKRLSEEISHRLAYSSDKKFALDARDNLILNTDFELPEEFLKRWLKEANKEMTEEQIENNFVNFAKDLRWQLIKNVIIKEHEINVSKEETMDYARQVAISQFYQYGVYQIPDEHLDSYTKKIMEKDEDREGIVRRIYENKVISVVKEKGTIIEKEVSSEEFNTMMDNIQEKES
jgi:trigger factor